MSDRINPTPAQKSELLRLHGMRCFIDGHPIENDEDLEFDHIVPVAAGGPTTLDNLAPVCKKHNRQKKTMSLSEYRDYLGLNTFFSDGVPKYLDDLILAKGQMSGHPLQFEISSNSDFVKVYLDSGLKEFSLYKCPVTK